MPELPGLLEVLLLGGGAAKAAKLKAFETSSSDETVRWRKPPAGLAGSEGGCEGLAGSIKVTC